MCSAYSSVISGTIKAMSRKHVISEKPFASSRSLIASGMMVVGNTLQNVQVSPLPWRELEYTGNVDLEALFFFCGCFHVCAEH